MQTKSHPGPLPLAEALIAWSDPKLIDEIRRATAKVDATLLDRMERYTFESIVTERRKPQRMRIPSLIDANLADLDRAWERLFSHFRLKVEEGLFVLEGHDNLSISGVQPVRIPSSSAIDLDIDPPAGAVFVGIHTYTNVTVSRVGGIPRADVANPSAPGQALPVTSPASAIPEGPTEVDVAITGKQIGRGRAPHAPLIIEALQATWDSVHRAVQANENWTTIAMRLRKHLERAHPELVHRNRIPTAETIRTRVGPLYQTELRRRAVL